MHPPVYGDVDATLLLDVGEDELLGLQHGHALGKDGLHEELAGLSVVNIQLVHLHAVLARPQCSPHLHIQLWRNLLIFYSVSRVVVHVLIGGNNFNAPLRYILISCGHTFLRFTVSVQQRSMF